MVKVQGPWELARFPAKYEGMKRGSRANVVVKLHYRVPTRHFDLVMTAEVTKGDEVTIGFGTWNLKVHECAKYTPKQWRTALDIAERQVAWREGATKCMARQSSLGWGWALTPEGERLLGYHDAVVAQWLTYRQRR